MELPEVLREQLTALVAEYVRLLPNRIEEIERAFEAVGEKPHEIETYAQLRLLVHKLAGSGATFGFDEITSSARELEDRLSTIIDSGLLQLDAADDELVRALERLKFACSTVDLKPAPENTGGQHEQKKNEEKAFLLREILLLSEVESDEMSDLGDQLGFFGFGAEYVADIASFEKCIRHKPNRLAIIHTNVLHKAGGAVDILKSVKTKYSPNTKYIFISERSDFETRLSALRAGSDAFFIIPFDIAKLIDTIESLSITEETEPYHVLIVDDDPEQVSYHALILQQAGMITSVASDPKTVLNVLVEAKPELILMDMYMPGCSGTELLGLIRQQEAFVSIPVVFLSIENAEAKKMAAIRMGGDDFISKPADPEFLIASISNRINRTREIRYFMERDSLTGLLNHSNLREQLVRELLRAERTSSRLCFAMIDLDRFKNVNDTYGHLTGDKVLKSLSRMLQERLRRTDIIGRYGGEEFGVILLNTDSQNAEQILNEIRENFSQIRHQSEDGEFFVTLSCGIACYPDYTGEGELAEAADKALYDAKEAGRNQVVVRHQ